MTMPSIEQLVEALDLKSLNVESGSLVVVRVKTGLLSPDFVRDLGVIMQSHLVDWYAARGVDVRVIIVANGDDVRVSEKDARAIRRTGDGVELFDHTENRWRRYVEVTP